MLTCMALHKWSPLRSPRELTTQSLLSHQIVGGDYVAEWARGPGGQVQEVVPSTDDSVGQSHGHGQGYRAHGGKAEDKEGKPVTKLGHLVKDMKIKSLEEIYLSSLPIKEFEITDFSLGVSLRDDVLTIIPVQKQIWAGQWTSVKAFVTVGDYNGHVVLDVKEVATAI